MTTVTPPVAPDTSVGNHIESLEGFFGWTLSNSSGTAFTLSSPIDVVDGGTRVVFHGTFTAVSGNMPGSGPVTSMEVYNVDPDGTAHLSSTWTSVSFDISDFRGWIALDDANPPPDGSIGAGAADFADAIFGGNDFIRGTGFADELYGLGGNDTILSGGVTGGGEILSGGDGNDAITLFGAYTSNTNIIDGGNGTDALAIVGGTVLNDPDSALNGYTVTDASGATIQSIETIAFASTFSQIAIFSASQFGGGSISTTANVFSNSGANIVEVLATGGSLNLNFVFDGAWHAMVGGEYEAGDDAVFIVGSGISDSVGGTSTGDRIEGNAGNDTINGNDGDDSLDGGVGVDVLHGGNGADFLELRASEFASGETYDGGAGYDLLYLRFDNTQTINLSLATLADIERVEFDSEGNAVTFLIASVSATQAATNLAADFTLRGSDVGILDGFVINATSAATLDVSAWQFLDWSGSDRVVFNGSTGNDSYTGTSGFDVINGGAGGIDVLHGGGGDDIIVADGGVSGETYDGGAGTADVFVVARSATTFSDPDSDLNGYYLSDYSAAAFSGLERLSFANPTGGLPNQLSNKLAIFTASQVGAGLSSSLLITGTDHSDVMQINAEGGALDLHGFTFASWTPMVNGEFSAGNVDVVYVVGSASADAVTGTVQGDVIVGADGNDTLTGGDGDDFLSSDAGVDQLFGGNGNDFLNVEVSGIAAGETYDGGAGADNLYVTFDTATLADLTTSTLAGIDRLEYDSDGNAATPLVISVTADQVATAFASNLELADSSPTITDILLITATSAATLNLSGYQLISWSGNDRVAFVGSNGNDTFTGTVGLDSIYAGDGTDTLNGYDGDDFIIANGATGAESFTGGNGFDTLVVERSNATVSGGAFDGFYVSDYTSATLATIERLNFTNATGGLLNQSANKIAVFDAADLTGVTSLVGISSFSDVVQINATGGVLNLSSLSLGNWNALVGVFNAGEDVVYVVGSGAADTITGTSQGDWILGNGAGDVLNGGDGNDILDGGVGADTMTGGLGDDTFVVDNAGDVANENASAGTDTVQASLTWTLGNGLENLTLTGAGVINGTGNTLNNLITGNDVDNILNGKSGDDVISAAAGADTLYGGDGNDTLSGGIGVDFLDAGNNDDNLSGGADNDTLYGRAGIDVLDGGTGADTMFGGAGNDTYVVDNTGDVTGESASAGTDTVLASVTYGLSTYLENLTLTGTDAINGTGNILANTMTGNDAANVLSGGAGFDTLFGMGGADTLNGGNGNDTLSGGTGNDLLDGGNDLDTLNGGDGADTLYGRTANDILNGDAGNDTLYGGDGADVLNGGDDNDLLDGLNHNDTLSGGNGDDTLYGRQNDDTLSGDAGQDTLYGGDGNDQLNGGAGADVLNGGNGDDVFTFNAGEANGDTIQDFIGNGAAAGDTLVFHGYGLAVDGATFVQLDATHWQINSADGLTHETIALANGAGVDPSDYLFG